MTHTHEGLKPHPSHATLKASDGAGQEIRDVARADVSPAPRTEPGTERLLTTVRVDESTPKAGPQGLPPHALLWGLQWLPYRERGFECCP